MDVCGVTLHETPSYDDRPCKGVSVNTFFPERGGDAAIPRAICATCPVAVRVACLEWALTIPEAGGWFGGTSEKERDRIRSVRWRARRGAA